jgi:hypothetical protein
MAGHREVPFFCYLLEKGMRLNKFYLIELILLYVLTGLGAVNAEQLIIDVSYEYETGDFSTPGDDVDIISIPVALTYFSEKWSYSVEIPYISLSGNTSFIPGSNGQIISPGKGSQPNIAASTKTITRSGLGDIRLSISRAFFAQNSNGPFQEVTATVKLATADDNENLGTGENDYSLKWSISTTVGRWLPGFKLGYQMKGDNADTDFDNTYFLSLGTGYQVARYTSVGLGYDYQQAATEDSDEFAALTFDISHEIEGGSKISFAVKKGFSDNSPDSGFSISYSMPY